MPNPEEIIQVGAVALRRSDFEQGIAVTASMRASAKKGAPLDADDVRTFLAIVMAGDQTVSDREWAELWLVYLTYADRMTTMGLDIIYKVLSGRAQDRGPQFGYTEKGATDLFFVYHQHHNNMTPAAKKELQGVLGKFIC